MHKVNVRYKLTWTIPCYSNINVIAFLFCRWRSASAVKKAMEDKVSTVSIVYNPQVFSSCFRNLRRSLEW